MSSEWHILQDDVTYCKHVLQSYRRTGLIEGMSYRRTHLIGVHVLQDGISYRRICLTGGQVLLEGMSYGRLCIT